MKLLLPALCSLALASAQTKPPLVDFELMTWPELKHAIHDEGRDTALIFNGGTEQRGPQGVAGAHTLVARVLGREIALKLGNAIVAPVIPFSLNRASAELPGTIGISSAVFAQLNEEVAEQMIANGFRNVVLMGDHGGGQKELAEVSKKLDAKYSPKGIRVVYCGDVYEKVGTDFNQWLADHRLPAGSHASIKDTSELWYLEGDQAWIRKDQIATAVGPAPRKPGEPRDPKAVNNGISGDARQSSPEIGKVVSEMKVNYAVAQIRKLLGTQSGGSPDKSQ